MSRGEFSFDPGVDICEVTEAKGLEFDYVVLPDIDADSYPLDDDSRRVFHVAVTRAMHQLWVGNVGTTSPLVAPGRTPGARLAGRRAIPRFAPLRAGRAESWFAFIFRSSAWGVGSRSICCRMSSATVPRATAGTRRRCGGL